MRNAESLGQRVGLLESPSTSVIVTISGMSSKQPVFVLVGGAWHIPAHYQSFLDVVAARGFRIVAPRLPSTVEGNTVDTVQADIKAVADVAQGFIDDGSDVVLIGHSAGGLSSAEAAHGLGRRELAAKGLPGGVRSLVLVAALGEPAGASLQWDEDSVARLGDQVMAVEVRTDSPALLGPQVLIQLTRVPTAPTGRIHRLEAGPGPGRCLLQRRSGRSAPTAAGHAGEAARGDGCVHHAESSVRRGGLCLHLLRERRSYPRDGAKEDRGATQGLRSGHQGGRVTVGAFPFSKHAGKVARYDP